MKPTDWDVPFLCILMAIIFVLVTLSAGVPDVIDAMGARIAGIPLAEYISLRGDND